MVIAAEWLKTVSRKGLGAGSFAAMRAKGDSVFDDKRYAGSPILIAGRNFGCGSSREHAVWSLLEMGIKAVIARSFSDIFASNAFKNGMVTIILDEQPVAHLLDAARDTILTIDLANQLVTTRVGDRFAFDFDPFRKACLLNGIDEIGLTERHADAIALHERKMAAERPFMLVGR